MSQSFAQQSNPFQHGTSLPTSIPQTNPMQQPPQRQEQNLMRSQQSSRTLIQGAQSIIFNSGNPVGSFGGSRRDEQQSMPQKQATSNLQHHLSAVNFEGPTPMGKYSAMDDQNELVRSINQAHVNEGSFIVGGGGGAGGFTSGNNNHPLGYDRYEGERFSMIHPSPKQSQGPFEQDPFSSARNIFQEQQPASNTPQYFNQSNANTPYMQQSTMIHHMPSNPRQLAQMEREFEDMRKQLEMAKGGSQLRQLTELESKEQELQRRLRELEMEQTEESEYVSQLRQQMVRHKKESNDIKKKEKDLEAVIWQRERDKEIEKLVMKKLAMEKMRSQQDMLDEILRKKEHEIQAIAEKTEQNDINSQGLLRRALERAEVLQKQLEGGAMDTKTQGQYVDAVLNKTAENELIRTQILEEVKAKMLRDKEDQKYKNEEIIQQLNMQRMRFEEAERAINEKKLMHQEVMKRGLEFLTEIELGRAPPLEYAVRSIQNTRDVTEEASQFIIQPVRAKDTALRVQQTIGQEEQKLKQLIDDYEKTLSLIDTTNYTDSYIPEQPIPPQKRAIVQPSIDQILNSVFKHIEEQELLNEESRERHAQLRQQYQVRENRIDKYTMELAVKQSRESMLEGLLFKLVQEVCIESIRVNDLARFKAVDIIAQAIKIQRGIQKPIEDIRSGLDKLQEAQTLERKRDVYKVNHSFVPIGTKQVSRLIDMRGSSSDLGPGSNLGNNAPQKQPSQNLPANVNKITQQDVYIDESAEVLDPNICLTYIDQPNLKEVEQNYFNGLNVKSAQLFGGLQKAGAVSVTALCVSGNGRLVAVALSNGIICVYETPKYTLIRIFPQIPGVIYHFLEFSRDNFSQLIALTNDGQAKTFLLKGRIPELPTEKVIEVPQGYIAEGLPIEQKPLELIPFYDVTHHHFNTADAPVTDVVSQSENRVTCVAMHPHMSFTGFQHQLLLGARNGQIMKWNANVSPHTFRHETSMRLYGQLYGESEVAQDIPYPGSKLESVIATAGPRGLDEQFVASAKRAAVQAQSGQVEKHMNREFFTGHKLPIVYICFVENSPGKIITIDDNGHTNLYNLYVICKAHLPVAIYGRACDLKAAL